jgi:putative addiction module killer protein
MLKIFEYVTNDGKCPFRDWLDNLRDIRAKARISTQLDRLALGNFGDSKPVGEGVIEIRLSYGPGYRIYVGRDGENLVILLCGGDKSSQKNDIPKAKALWASYQKEKTDAR